MPHATTSSSDSCPASKTLCGPIPFLYPTGPFNQSDTFYFEQLPDGAYLLTGHGSHNIFPGVHDEDRPSLILNPEDGLGGEFVATESVMGSM